MATTVWDHLCDRAVVALELGTDVDEAARQLLAASGGDRRAVLTAHMRMAAETVDYPDDLPSRQVLALFQRAIVIGDTEGLWHPVYANLNPWEFARHHAD